MILAIENHQDFGSEELLEFCDLGGDSVGICLDTGNPLAVAETPLSFARTVAPRVQHVHLKDYRAQMTSDGYRLVRCPIGDGAIPLVEIEAIVSACTPDVTATLEPGALQARHIKLLTEEWWKGYQPKSQEEIDDCLQAASYRALSPDEDYRTPAELEEGPESVCHFEMEQIINSIQNMKSIGWLPL
jgi:sugar phosphate isomerase/epimerase